MHKANLVPRRAAKTALNLALSFGIEVVYSPFGKISANLEYKKHSRVFRK